MSIEQMRRIVLLILALLGLLWLFSREQQIRIEQIPQLPIRAYRHYLPMVAKDYPRHPLRGVAASGNGGVEDGSIRLRILKDGIYSAIAARPKGTFESGEWTSVELGFSMLV